MRKKKEAVLHSPAHAGMPATTTVLTSKDGDKKGQSLTCDSTICHLNDVHDDLYHDPEIIAHVYSLLAKTRSTRRVRVADSATINYVVRSNHQIVSASEIENLPESMKAVSSGKLIMISDTTILTERPNTNFTFDYRRKVNPDGRTYCGDRYGCGSTNEKGCSWSFKFTTKPQNVTPADSVHSLAFDNYCITCCGNSDSFPDHNRYVLCDDITRPSYLVRRQAFNTAVAVTLRERYGPDSKAVQCGDLYPFYKKGCKHYGNGNDGNGLGACVTSDAYPCPPERQPPVWN